MSFDLNAIVQGAKAKKATPYKTFVRTEDEGKKLAQDLETLLVGKGFSFIDIEGDKRNDFCVVSRKGELPILGGKATVHVCIRLFGTRAGAMHCDLTVQ
jgi:hypothetical protein